MSREAISGTCIVWIAVDEVDSAIRIVSLGRDPSVDLHWIEPHKLSYLEKWHSVFGGQAADKALGYAKLFGEGGSVD